MTPKLSEKIQALIDAGMTQTLIEDKTKIPQSRVSRLGSGATKRPSWSDVELIDKLYEHVVTNKQPWDSFKKPKLEDA